MNNTGQTIKKSGKSLNNYPEQSIINKYRQLSEIWLTKRADKWKDKSKICEKKEEMTIGLILTWCIQNWKGYNYNKNNICLEI